MKGVNFVKKLSMTKKRSSEIVERIEGNFFKIFCLKINLPKIFAPPIFVTQIFAPPIFMTSLRRSSHRRKEAPADSGWLLWLGGQQCIEEKELVPGLSLEGRHR